jgi:hypothetical protein
MRTNEEWLKALQGGKGKALRLTEREYRRFLRDEYREHAPERFVRNELAHGLGGESAFQRVRVDADGEGWRAYGFVTDELAEHYGTGCDSLTDAEIADWLSEFMAVGVRSDYDCSGQSFTQWIHWHRNPNGSVSFVHQMGIDV